MTQHALVTGAGGFVGGALAMQLAKHGNSVRAMLRDHALDSRVARALRENGIEVVAGDMRDAASLTNAVRDRSHVYHLAARKSNRTTPAAHITGVNFDAVHDREVLVTSKRSTSEKARREIGYEPTRSIQEATKDMVAQFVADSDLPS